MLRFQSEKMAEWGEEVTVFDEILIGNGFDEWN